MPDAAQACPGGHRLDAARSQRLEALLASQPRGQALLARAERPLTLCFGQRHDDSTVTTTGIFLIEERLEDREAAARLGHLLLHHVEGLGWLTDRERPCDQLVEEAVAAEARAHALELELRRDLGVTAPRRTFPFAEAAMAAPSEGRVEVIRRWLLDHPEGGEGMLGLVAAYGHQCRARRAQRP